MRNRSMYYCVLISVLGILLAGCGFNRYHQYTPPDAIAGDAPEGWSITPRLERLDEGVGQDVENYTMIISAEPVPARRRFRLAIDSVEVFLPPNNPLQTQRLLLEFDNRQTEIAAFERQYPNVRLPTGPGDVYCKLHMTQFNSESQETWNQTVDFEFQSTWKKKLWILKNKAK
jgi:hypothetical protein